MITQLKYTTKEDLDCIFKGVSYIPGAATSHLDLFESDDLRLDSFHKTDIDNTLDDFYRVKE